MASLTALCSGIEFAGIGGPRMEALGFTSLFPMRELAVMGLVEVLPRVLPLRRRLAEAVSDIDQRRPDLIVTIDSPGFTLRVLAQVAALGIPRVHYVAPQVWAWREHRVRHFPGLWERLLCLLPFEPAYFASHGLPARFVGHPVLQSGAEGGDAARFRLRHGLAADARVLVLMPGSRRSEAPRLLPVFGRTLARLSARLPGLVPVIPASPVVAETVAQVTADWPVRPILVTGIEDKHDAYAAAGAALTKSGTSTLELALAGVPMAVTYRVNPLTAAMARRMIRVPHVAMVNLLAGRQVVPELLQERCTAHDLAAIVERLFDEPGLAADQRAAFRAVTDSLRAPGWRTGALPSDAAALEILDLLGHPVRQAGAADQA